MSYVSLTKSDEWRIRNNDKNIIDWDVRDAKERRVGRVADLIIDTETEYVETVVLDDGTEVPASDVHLDSDEKIVYLDQYESTEKEPAQPGADAYAEDFRNHYEATYVSADTPYTTFYEPAYLFGFRAGADDQFRDQPFEKAEEDLRAEFDNRFQNRRFSELREAVRYGYQRARNR